MAEYEPAAVESKWRSRWQAQPPHRIDLSTVTASQKFYNLAEFPYPSAEGLHVGHVYTYCGSDVLGRYARMTGRQVFQPIGYDSFGIPGRIAGRQYRIPVPGHPDRLHLPTKIWNGPTRYHVGVLAEAKCVRFRLSPRSAQHVRSPSTAV